MTRSRNKGSIGLNPFPKFSCIVQLRKLMKFMVVSDAITLFNIMIIQEHDSNRL